MANILVAGLINIETTLRVEGFPIHYNPVNYPFFGVSSTVSGVGFNLAKALTVLGNQVNLLSVLGRDMPAGLVRTVLDQEKIDGRFITNQLSETPQSVILYDPQGQRQIHVDLKDIQEAQYPEDAFESAAQGAELLCLCNINFSRPFLLKAQQMGKWIATDVHALSDLEDNYNREYMAAAQILFMSDDHLSVSSEDFARQILNRYGVEILVMGLGAKGALLAIRRDHFMERVPIVTTRPVVNTIGAGDALFSAFIHSYLKDHDPYDAIQKAMVFASWKVGTRGAAEGFLDPSGLDQLTDRLKVSKLGL